MLYIIGIIITLVIIYIILTFNNLTKLKNKVKEAFSVMDVYLKKRWDLIPNLVEIVKGYASYEKGTLEEISKLRTGSYETLSDKDKLQSDEILRQNVVRIMALAESYPDLKANEHFKDLANQLTQVEDEIANSRKYYSAIVRDYNNKIEMFPNSIIANIIGFKRETMFEADINEKENIKIDYSKEK